VAPSNYTTENAYVLNGYPSMRISLRMISAVAPPLLGYSIREFCGAVGISVSYFYELKQAGLAPRTMRLGSRRIISVEEAQKWCRERTEASESAKREARQP
jgi:predicted DNA-binding transcriptional regulator AlpA